MEKEGALNILGLSFDYHDSAAALLVEGQVVAAAQEERFTRKKYDEVFPSHAIDACLEMAGLKMTDIDHVAYYEEPMMKFDRILYGVVRALPGSRDYLGQTLASWFKRGKFDVKKRIMEYTGLPADRVHLVRHHQAHAASAFFCSGFDQAAVVTLDGVGEYDTASISLGRGTKLRQIKSVRYPDSIGLFYSALTAFLGFKVNSGEYKVMGMAGFGQPRYRDLMYKMIRPVKGGFKLDQSYFSFFAPRELPYSPRLVEMLGPPREPESPFDVGDLSQPAPPGSEQEKCRHYADIAASLQLVTEEIILDFVRYAVKRTGLKQVAMAGGVALNSVANGRLLRELGLDLYVQPAAGDAGGSLGAALYFHCCRAGQPRPRPLDNVYLGRRYQDEDVRRALKEAAVDTWEYVDDFDRLAHQVAGLLKEGAVIGWFQDRFEWGPRALGCRSILGNPGRADMQRIINEKIKFREPFRPFAPAVLAERATEFFDMPQPTSRLQPENYMLAVWNIKPEARKRIPAVTHVDGTGRVQLVWKEQNPGFRRLIEAFEEQTGLPVLLNTSFNRRGEPIVNTPDDALTTFMWSGLDYVVINNFLVKKQEVINL